MRVERDSMGEMQVADEALYGAQTRRAELNFPISGWPLPKPFLMALARIKRAAAEANRDLGLLDAQRADWIVQAADEVLDGRHDAQFVLDVFQTGSGTSTNMNMNEVLSNRAIQLAGGTVGSRDPVHPNDHVNLGQSSNDVIPTALQVAGAEQLAQQFLPALAELEEALQAKASALDGIVTIGRTHLQDATPIRLGQIFAGYVGLVREARARLRQRVQDLCSLPIGGTAVGTGINTHREFGARVAAKLAEATGLPLVECDNHFAAHGSRSAVVAAVAELKTTALDLVKIANDVRFLASGPRCGIGELKLPAVQPGSSIMPGKVNPVICESLLQVCSFVVGADAAVSHAATVLSNFELCVALPLTSQQLLESLRLLTNATRVFTVTCVRGLEADIGRCEGLIEGSLAMCTSLVPAIGYDAAAAVAKEAYATGRTVREVALAKKLLPEDELARLLDARRMTEPEG